MIGNKAASRNINIEILRVIAMFMIIIGHALGHGGALDAAEGPVYYLIHILNILIIPSVNIYVLISGYYLIDAKLKISRIFMLWAQVAFYSIFCFTAALLTGNAAFSFSSALKAFLPISGDQYWFARVYWGFYIFSPFAAILLKRLTQSQYKVMLALSIVIFSLWRSFIPFAVTLNSEGGNSVMWFFILFSFAGYIRLYGTQLKKPQYYMALCGAGYTVTCVIYFVLVFISNYLGLAGKGTSLFTVYTSITVIWVSVTFFLTFISIKKRYGEFVGKAVMFFSSSAYSVYLIHENIYVKRWLWNVLDPAAWVKSSLGVVHIFGAAAVIFVIAVLIDKCTWNVMGKLLKKIRFEKTQLRLDALMQHN